MAELERPGSDPEQSSLLEDVQCRCPGAHGRCRRRHGGLPAAVLGGSDQQQGLRVGGQAAHPLQERPLNRVGQRQLGRERFLPRELFRRQQRRQFGQGQRIAAGLLDQ
ncbi:MAG TPA: hypothetical protein VF880_10505, partial [Actinomycetes bacterium]